jgi:hypothetical protein
MPYFRARKEAKIPSAMLPKALCAMRQDSCQLPPRLDLRLTPGMTLL